VNGNRGAQQEFCFNSSYKINCIISTVTNYDSYSLGVRCKNDSIGFPEPDKKMRFQLLVFLGIPLHPKTYDSTALVTTSPTLQYNCSNMPVCWFLHIGLSHSNTCRHIRESQLLPYCWYHFLLLCDFLSVHFIPMVSHVRLWSSFVILTVAATGRWSERINCKSISILRIESRVAYILKNSMIHE